MSESIPELLAWPFMMAGSFLYLVGSLGLMRMPDVYTRMHATSVSDTLGAGLLLIGMMLTAGFSLITAKLLVILLILLYTGPVATHALARAARYAKVEPILHKAKGTKSSKR